MLDILDFTGVGRKDCNLVPYNLSLNKIPSCLRTKLCKMQQALIIWSQVVNFTSKAQCKILHLLVSVPNVHSTYLLGSVSL